jgi:putative transcriptional regulator
MKSGGTTKVSRNPGDPLPDTGTDWSKVDALSDAEIRAAALADPDAQPLATADATRLTKLVNVKKLRERLGQTQEAFAARDHIPLGTLRDWEQRRKHPDAPARAYLLVIAQDPDRVAALLHDAA